MSSCVPGRAAGAPCGKSRPCPPRSGCLQSRRRCFSPVPMQAHLRRVKGESPLLSRGGKTGAAPLHSHSLPYRGLSAQRPWFLPRRIHSSGGKTCRSAAAAAGRRGNIPEPAEERRRGSPASRRIPASGQKAAATGATAFFANLHASAGSQAHCGPGTAPRTSRRFALRGDIPLQRGSGPAERSRPDCRAGAGGQVCARCGSGQRVRCPAPCRCARAWRAGGFPKRRTAFAAILRGAS